MVAVLTTFIATGCAQRSQVLVWSPKGFLIYASAGELVVAELKKSDSAARILRTTAAHSADITCLTIDGDFLRSGCAQGWVAVWKLTNDGELELVEKYEAHPNLPVTFCVGCGDLLTASSSSDGRLLIRRSAENQQELRFGSTFVLCAAFYKWAEGSLILAAATSNSKIEILYEHNGAFKRGIALAGHSDWVRSIAFRGNDDGSFICASAGQDCVVRLYKFENEESISAPQDPEELRVRPLKLEISPALSFHVTMEAVLFGHEGWIHSVQWHPTQYRLLSASIDKCLVVWEPSEGGSGVWLEKVRVGEVGGQAVGYYGAVFANDGLRIVGHSYFGGIYVWHPEDEANPDEIIWHPESAVGGHFSNVVDIDWDPSGSYLVSCSSDQTTRTYAPIGVGYAEIGRPQVHGHNLNCLVSITSSCLVSGAEEKIFRAFRAPKTFANSLANLSGYNKENIFTEALSDYGAGVPSLGLSNKAIEQGEMSADAFGNVGGATKEEVAALISNPMDLTEPPTEDHLMQNTLWPEMHKLYGHGFEVFAIAANKAGTLIATSCKASQTDHAAIMLWDTKEWQRRCDLLAHQLTVTQLDFAPSGDYLLSVSRDRTFAIFKSGSGFSWAKVFQSSKATGVHSRIIWACSWSHDSSLFATVSRDKKLAVWKVSSDDAVENIGVITLDESVTAVQFAPGFTADGKYAIASGLENGVAELFSFDAATGAFESLHQFDQSESHSRTIRRLRFRPVEGAWQSEKTVKKESQCWELASCSDDHCVKVHRIEF